MDLVNHQVRLAARPQSAWLSASDCDYAEEPVPEPGDGEVLVKIRFIALDPAMRGWMNEGRSYIPPVEIGEVMRAGRSARWSSPSHSEACAGDYVTRSRSACRSTRLCNGTRSSS